MKNIKGKENLFEGWGGGGVKEDLWYLNLCSFDECVFIISYLFETKEHI